MCLDMLLEILRTLEGFAAEVAFVRLKWHVYANVRCDMISLHSGGAAATPLASQIQIIGALTTDMTLANVVLGLPLAFLIIVSSLHMNMESCENLFASLRPVSLNPATSSTENR
jgi:hypothetical protein